MVTGYPSDEDIAILETITMTEYDDEKGEHSDDDDSMDDDDSAQHTSNSQVSICYLRHDYDPYDNEDSVSYDTDSDDSFIDTSRHEVLARAMNKRRRIMSSELEENDRREVARLERLGISAQLVGTCWQPHSDVPAYHATPSCPSICSTRPGSHESTRDRIQGA